MYFIYVIIFDHSNLFPRPLAIFLSAVFMKNMNSFACFLCHLACIPWYTTSRLKRLDAPPPRSQGGAFSTLTSVVVHVTCFHCWSVGAENRQNKPEAHTLQPSQVRPCNVNSNTTVYKYTVIQPRLTESHGSLDGGTLDFHVKMLNNKQSGT